MKHEDIDHTGLTGISSGSVATDAIWDAAGDLAVGSGANTAARLAIGATNGMVVSRVSGAVAWDLPPGHEFDYVAKTSTTNITATVEASADTIITGNAVSYNGSTVVWIEFGAPYLQQPGADANMSIWLFDGSSSIGRIALATSPNATGYSANFRTAGAGKVRLTPSNASHTYSIRGTVSSGTGVVGANSGGSGVDNPAYLRIYKA